MNIVILSALFFAGCELSEEQNLVTEGDHTKETTDESIESLDRTLDNMNKMVADMEKMNHNLDAIFEAVTDCNAVSECDELKAKYHRKYIENNSKEVKE